MKKIYLHRCTILLVCVSACFVNGNAQSYHNNFTLTGSLNNLNETIQMVYLVYSVDGNNISDSSLIKNGRYSFSGHITEPVQASLEAKYVDGAGKQNTDWISVFLDTANISIVSENKFSNDFIKGSKAQTESEELDKELKEVQQQLRAVLERQSIAKKSNQNDLADACDKELTALSKMTCRISGDYAKKNPQSHIAMYALNLFCEIDFDKNVKEAEKIYLTLPEKSRNSYTGKNLFERIMDEKLTGVGKTAFDFSQKDSLLNNIRLSSFKGKYILLDFWASWCIPCRKENPDLLIAYNEYKINGFQIIGVSIDKKREDWRKAIKDDKTNWLQLHDEDHSIEKLYRIHSIPTNFLIDPQGVIIKKNISGKELETILEKIYANSNQNN